MNRLQKRLFSQKRLAGDRRIFPRRQPEDRVRSVDIRFQINVHCAKVTVAMKTIGKVFAVLLTAGIFYLGTYVFGSVPIGRPLFYGLATLLVGSVVGLIILAKKLK